MFHYHSTPALLEHMSITAYHSITAGRVPHCVLGWFELCEFSHLATRRHSDWTIGRPCWTWSNFGPSMKIGCSWHSLSLWSAPRICILVPSALRLHVWDCYHVSFERSWDVVVLVSLAKLFLLMLFQVQAMEKCRQCAASDLSAACLSRPALVEVLHICLATFAEAQQLNVESESVVKIIE